MISEKVDNKLFGVLATLSFAAAVGWLVMALWAWWTSALYLSLWIMAGGMVASLLLTILWRVS